MYVSLDWETWRAEKVNRIMKQLCPKCGNWVEGIEVSKPYIGNETRENLKEGAGWIAKFGGALDGIDGGLGRMVTGFMGEFAKGAIDLAADNIHKKSLKFSCSCGEEWNAPLGSGFSDQEVKDIVLFQQAWNFFFENSDSILSSVDNVNAFLSEYESKEIISPLPKSELNFLLALCSYCAIDLNSNYVSTSHKYIDCALNDMDDCEYRLFVELINNKSPYRYTASIVPNAIKLLDELKEENALLKQEWYWEQLQDAIKEETQKYKKEKIEEKKSYLIRNSLFPVPVLLFVIYQYANYDTPDGFWSTLFSWVPIFWLVLLAVGGPYLIMLFNCWDFFSRTDEVWQNEYISQYTSFKWSDLLK